MAAARKVSAAHSRTVLPSGAQHLGQFADGRGLAGAVHSNHQDYFRRPVHAGDGLSIGGGENGENFFLEQPFEFVHVPDLLAVGFFAELLQYFVSRGRAQVSPQERGFKIVQRGPVDFLAERDDVFDALAQVFPGASHRFLHAIKETGFLLFVEAAKESLNHEFAGPGGAEVNYSGRGVGNQHLAISNWHLAKCQVPIAAYFYRPETSAAATAARASGADEGVTEV